MRSATAREHDDERTEQHAEGLQRTRDAPGDRLGAIDRVELGNHLARDQLRGGDDQEGDDRRDRDRDAVAERAAERAFEDAASAGSPSAPMPIEVIVTPICTAEMYSLMSVSCVERQRGPSGAFVAHHLQARAARAHERVLGDHEEGVDRDQHAPR